MANRTFRGDLLTAEQGLVMLAGVVRIGPGGVPFETATDKIPFVSASRGSSAGVIHLDFEDPFVAMRSWSFNLQNSGSADLHVDMSGSNPRTTANHVSSSAGQRTTIFVRSGSTGVDHEGIKISCNFLFKNSSV